MSFTLVNYSKDVFNNFSFRVKHYPQDRYGEKNVKAAYFSFKERRMQELKAENPKLRFTQLSQLLLKEFNKSSENPMNQLCELFNSKL